MNKKYSIDSMQQLAKERNMIFLSNTYVNCDCNYEWQCLKCNHIWNATPSNVKGKGSGCPRCAGQCKSKQDMNDLAKSNGILFLSKEYKGMRTRHEWGCYSGHKWMTAPYHIQNGTKCPHCHSNINEAKCRFIIESMTGESFPSDWKKLENGMQLDGYCESLNMAFEYNGEQHYKMHSYFHKNELQFKSQQLRDKIKDEKCKSKNIHKITIPYFYTKTNEELESFIEKCLRKLGIEILSVNWDNFVGKPSKLENLKSLISSRGMVCLSKKYIHAKHKLLFRCMICDHKWQATPCNIKSGYGCPQCGYVKRVESRRKTLVNKKLRR